MKISVGDKVGPSTVLSFERKDDSKGFNRIFLTTDHGDMMLPASFDFEDMKSDQMDELVKACERAAWFCARQAEGYYQL